MIEFPASRLKFPTFVKNLQKYHTHYTLPWSLIDSKIFILISIISPPFSGDPTDFIGVCNSKQVCYWKCRRKWSFIENQQILASVKSLFAWFCNHIYLITAYGGAAEIWTMSESKTTAMRHKKMGYCKPKLFNSIFLISDSFIHARNVAEKLKRILWSCNHSHSKKKPNSLNRAIKHMYMYNLMAMCYKFLSRALLFVKKGTDFRNFYPN